MGQFCDKQTRMYVYNLWSKKGQNVSRIAEKSEESQGNDIPSIIVLINSLHLSIFFKKIY